HHDPVLLPSDGPGHEALHPRGDPPPRPARSQRRDRGAVRVPRRRLPRRGVPAPHPQPDRVSGPGRAAVGFWPTVGLLLGFAYRRSRGRAERRSRLLAQKGRHAVDLGPLSGLLSVVVFAGIHGAVAFLLYDGLRLAERVSHERDGRMAVSAHSLLELQQLEASTTGTEPRRDPEAPLRSIFRPEPDGTGSREERQAYVARLVAHYPRYVRARLGEYRE